MADPIPLVPIVPLDKTMEAISGFIKANTSDVLGAPADIAYALNKGLSRNSEPAPPTYGSDYFRKLFFGADAVETKSLTEVAGSLVSPGGVAGVGKAMIVGAIPKLAMSGVSTAKASKILTRVDELANSDQAVQFFQQTGVFKGVENAAKAVISDSSAVLNLSKFEDLPMKTGATAVGLRRYPDWKGGYATTELKDILDHPDLYKIHPELKNIKIESDTSMSLNNAMFDPNTQKIILGPQKDAETAMSSVLHEVQHAIQNSAGFAEGTNPNALREFRAIELTPERLQNIRDLRDAGNPHAQRISAMLNADTRAAGAKYKANPGEAEARFTESTMKLSQQQLEDRVMDVIKNPLPTSFWDK